MCLNSLLVTGISPFLNNTYPQSAEQRWLYDCLSVLDVRYLLLGLSFLKKLLSFWCEVYVCTCSCVPVHPVVHAHVWKLKDGAG